MSFDIEKPKIEIYWTARRKEKGEKESEHVNA
jgi:hypothetical protein